MQGKTRLVIVMIVTAGIGCSGAPDERFNQLANESLARQAEQNEVIARQSDRLAEAGNKYLEAETRSREQIVELQQEMVQRDAEARTELTELARQTQAEQVEAGERIDRQRQQLQEESQAIAAQRRWDSVAAAALAGLGTAVLCVAPLALAAYIVYLASRSGDEDVIVGEALVRQLHEGPQAPLLNAQRPAALADQREAVDEQEKDNS